MDNREIRFYDGTVDCLKSIAKSLERIARYYDKIEAIMDKEDGNPQEPEKETEETEINIPESFLTFGSYEEVKEVREGLISYSAKYGKVPLGYFYQLIDLDPKFRDYAYGWKSLNPSDIVVYNDFNFAGDKYTMELPPVVRIE